jgi:restriction endonuclease S subunit
VDNYLYEVECLIIPKIISKNKIYYAKGKVYPSNNVYIYKIKEGTNGKYIMYYQKYYGDILFKKKSNKFQSITMDDINNMDINILPREKQEEIVKYCDNICDLNILMLRQIDLNKELMKKIMSGIN